MNRTLQIHLAEAVRRRSGHPLCVAFSGGPDSSALLHALAGMDEVRQQGLRALHVDHGLHPDSALWARQARSACTALGVPCEVLPVQVDTTAGIGVEAAAREARYAALAEALRPGEWLVLGHHRDDQVETVLLKLLRGAGPDGLGGMRERRPLGAGQLWRPLLDLPRAILADYVARHGLACIDDPANAALHLARNVLRHAIVPRLLQTWPQACDAITHSAALCRDAADALRAQWLTALADLRDPADDTLDAAGWLALPPGLRAPLLDHWLHARGLTAPTTAQRRQIERQADALPGRVPCIRWPGAELHIWRGRLWALAPAAAFDPDWQADWDGAAALRLPDGGSLALSGEEQLTRAVTVRLRRGGEHIRPAGDRHTRELRDLFQTDRVPPWRRLACPVIVEDEAIVAIGDRWVSERGMALLGDGRLVWRPAR